MQNLRQSSEESQINLRASNHLPIQMDQNELAKGKLFILINCKI